MDETKQDETQINQQVIENTNQSIKRTKCERYSRIVGYLRPLQQWNKGKQAEWVDRKTFVFGRCDNQNIVNEK